MYMCVGIFVLCFFFFKQKTAYELRISDWSSDVCSSDLGYFPNLAVLNSGVNPVVFIRGFGSGPNNVAFDQEVSVYLDGIYGGRGAQFSAPFFDLERMEVLRGPQGALFGRNTAAGAISLVSAKPGNRFEGHVSAGYDFERDGYDVSGVVSGPVRSEEHTSELQSLMRNSYAVFCLKT